VNTIQEKWLPVKDYPGYYISNLGRVYSAKVNRLLKFGTTRKVNGYYIAHFSKDNKAKCFLVHRLVYETFVGKVPDGLQINHKDEDKHNNRLDNLEVVTPSENIRYGSASKRGATTRKERYPEWSVQLRKPCINETTGIKYVSASEAARQTGGKKNSIINACLKYRKTYRGQIWSYL
jgi:hypothetical protein